MPVVVKKKMPFSCQEGIRPYVFLGNHCCSHKETLYILRWNSFYLPLSSKKMGEQSVCLFGAWQKIWYLHNYTKIQLHTRCLFALLSHILPLFIIPKKMTFDDAWKRVHSMIGFQDSFEFLKTSILVNIGSKFCFTHSKGQKVLLFYTIWDLKIW